MNESNKFEWSGECKSAITDLKKEILEAPILGYPNNSDSYTLTTDASLTAIGASHTQNKELGIELLHMLAKI